MVINTENSWHKEGGLWRDPDLDRVRSSPLSYRPRPFQPVDCQPDAVLTLRGPRRAGKTVALKLLVAELIEDHHIPPSEIIWTSFEAMRGLDPAEDRLRSIARHDRLRILLIDEVTAIVGWQQLIKKLKDEGLFAKSTLILTGSSAHDLKRGAERMAGRRGSVENPDRVLMPMSFADFERQLVARLGRLDDAELISRYFEAGGFPFRVEACLKALANQISFDPFAQFQVFDDVFFYEIGRRRFDRNVAIEMAGRLAQVGCHAISTDAFAKPLTVSRETAKRYLDAMGDSFLMATIFSYDLSRGRVAPKKDRKFLWVDPALANFAAWLGLSEPAGDAEKAEIVVAAELLRRHERRIWEGLSAPRNVFTWKSSGGNEVDFLVIDAAKKLREPIEVKYQNEISAWDFQVMERAFKRATIISKGTRHKRPFGDAMPLTHFLRGDES